MTATRLLAVFAVGMMCIASVAAQTQKPGSVAARLEALEKENASLRADVSKLQAQLGQTRRDVTVERNGRMSGYALGATVQPTLQPMDLGAQQAQTNAALQSQGLNQQLNNMQMQQNLNQDRARDQALFQPQPFGAAP